MALASPLVVRVEKQPGGLSLGETMMVSDPGWTTAKLRQPRSSRLPMP